MKDRFGVYDLTPVVAITRGGTPNRNLKVGHDSPTAILHLANGHTIQTFVPFEQARAEFEALKVSPPAAPAQDPAPADPAPEPTA